MSERHKVIFQPNGDFVMHLTNGPITVPGLNGCYVLSTGCGSGKTECCKSIIRQRHNEGILYCVDTIEEMNKMYQWILAEHLSMGIDMNDVMAISSDQEQFDELRAYQENPEILLNKKVILLTHVRFWTDLINYFLIYNPQYQVNEFDGDFQNLMSRPDLRKFVLFDETPRFIKPFFTMPHYLLSSFTLQDADRNWYSGTPQYNQEVYNHFLKGKDIDPFPKGESKLVRIKRTVIFNQIPYYFGYWINSNKPTVNITFTPSHLAQQHVNTKILILEGAGDVLFQNSQYFQQIKSYRKYNCGIRFEPFPFNVERRKELNPEAYENLISFLTTRIWSNQQNGKKTLVAIWMNQGEDSQKSKDNKYYNSVKSRLYGDLRLSPLMYDVIYYGSAECKSTNQYCDYSELILAGDWGISNAEVKKFNKHFGVKIDARDQKLWYFVQLLCRIGIRQYDGNEYSVCYSSDFDPTFITDLENYLTRDILPIKQTVYGDDQAFINHLQSIGVNKSHRDGILALTKYDHLLKDNILRNQTYTLSITLNEIFKRIPKPQKRKDRYNSLINCLGKFGITLKIVK